MKKTIELTEQELKVVLLSLQKQSFELVNDLINNIINQIRNQQTVQIPKEELTSKTVTEV